MPTRRFELRSSLMEHIRKARVPGLVVSSARAFSLGDNQLPQVSITGDSEKLVVLGRSPRVYRRTLALRLTHLVGLRLGQAIEDELDRNLQRLEGLVHAWCPPEVHEVRVTEGDVDVFLEGRLQCGASLLAVEVTYDTEEPCDEVEDSFLRTHVEVAA